MKNIFALVFVTAAIAPPPFAAPSSFVIIIPPIELTFVNAFEIFGDLGQAQPDIEFWIVLYICVPYC